MDHPVYRKPLLGGIICIPCHGVVEGPKPGAWFNLQQLDLPCPPKQAKKSPLHRLLCGPAPTCYAIFRDLPQRQLCRPFSSCAFHSTDAACGGNDPGIFSQNITAVAAGVVQERASGGPPGLSGPEVRNVPMQCTEAVSHSAAAAAAAPAAAAVVGKPIEHRSYSASTHAKISLLQKLTGCLRKALTDTTMAAWTELHVSPIFPLTANLARCCSAPFPIDLYAQLQLALTSSGICNHAAHGRWSIHRCVARRRSPEPVAWYFWQGNKEARPDNITSTLHAPRTNMLQCRRPQ